MRIIFSSTLAAICLIAALSVNACESTEGGPEDWTFKQQSKPAWVESGRHATYKAPSDVFVMRNRKGGEAPGAGEMLNDLRTSLHQLLLPALKPLLEESALASAIDDGLWVGPANIPTLKWKREEWSDGQFSAAFASIDLKTLEQHNQTMIATLGDPQEGPRNAADEARKEASLDSPAARFRRRVLNFDRDLSMMAAIAFSNASQWAYQADATCEVPAPLIERTKASAKALLEYPQLVRVVSSNGGEQRIPLGSVPSQDIELVLREGGQGAAGLPVKGHADGLEIAGYTSLTDESGACSVQLAGPVGFSGKAMHLAGLTLDPDRWTSGLRTGLALPPWNVRVFLPARSNTGVRITLIEKVGNVNQEGESAVITQHLREWLQASGIGLIDSAQDAERYDFVLELGGVIDAREREGDKRSSRRTYAVEALISLRMERGPFIASIKLFGSADFFGEEPGDAAQRALENTWAKDKEALREEMRRGFPPIFPSASDAN